ncbi:hypothetical protein QJS04_geneDACA016111 [Acorus gramineus]|uniref:Vacuolar ATPase assembly integral membrane protein VMA21 homolog n=1 Tax=Acorus gramineus TaxID=55184 RepID=A0AAV9BYN1_ACOGR|nr:hypothetical protein QJS04_geneDACA023353 [Acorus gramineus]KAK1281033.1 hypothetical protein QJS04_geneDACA016111 [Acorus gramineus]
MPSVVVKFFLASMALWIAPLSILYGFNHHIFPGSSQLSPSSHTLISGFIAVISVNMVIIFYIIMAMKEPPSRQHQPDPSFLAEAKASISQSPRAHTDGSDQGREKEE